MRAFSLRSEGLKTLLVSPRGDGSAPLPPTGAGRPGRQHDLPRPSPAQAFDIVHTPEELRTNDFPILYKKIDSTLRGNIGAEIDAILRKPHFPSVSWPRPTRSRAGRWSAGS